MVDVAISASNSASAQLKAGTQALHHQLDHQSAMQRLLADDLTLAEYASLLKRMWRCYQVVQIALDAFVLAHSEAAHWVDPAIYHRTQDIEQDLRVLQKQAHMQLEPELIVPSALALQDSSQTLRLLTPAQAAGCMYVLGGARMGARVITRALISHFGDSVAGALHFFNPTHPGDAPDFSALRTKLDAALHNPCAVQEALCGARQVFGIFIHEFSKTG